MVARLMSGNDTYNLGAANDVVAGLAGSDTINGGDGTDVSLHFGLKSEHSVKLLANGSVEVTRGHEKDVLNDIEILRFNDGDLRLDIDGNAGETFRLYQAAFDRTPDQGGLKYWIDRIDGGTTLDRATASFIASKEFADTYGADLSNADFINAMYANVLDRLPDAGGLQFWVDQLDAGTRDRASVLVGFSESDENFALVGSVIADGIWR